MLDDAVDFAKNYISRFIAPMFGYNNSTEYYKDICISRCLKETQTFTICVNADDDPCYSKEVSNKFLFIKLG